MMSKVSKVVVGVFAAIVAATSIVFAQTRAKSIDQLVNKDGIIVFKDYDDCANRIPKNIYRKILRSKLYDASARIMFEYLKISADPYAKADDCLRQMNMDLAYINTNFKKGTIKYQFSKDLINDAGAMCITSLLFNAMTDSPGTISPAVAKEAKDMIVCEIFKYQYATAPVMIESEKKK